MTLLLDTRVFLWWLDDPKLLSALAHDAIRDGKNTVYVSAAVVWEIAIKRSLGKLDAPDDLLAAMEANRFLPLPSVFHTHSRCSGSPVIIEILSTGF